MVEESRADTATTILPPNDISVCVGKAYSNAEKLRMLKNIAMPDQTFKFPITEIYASSTDGLFVSSG